MVDESDVYTVVSVGLNIDKDRLRQSNVTVCQF
jgi:hypothetical protein